ncbi:hypothetical protein OE749_17465 [Aestuariibacter sp. AA17]|uniref:Uncharacterized protein n=1 Tax=Fluctibacter corallii TaxID=2984329 RepID=A0ABT3ACW0_9ALTE|nr:hypothetical protein [Aestuariibacter sp. AA17]MCV2886488.1 hypothetical protein [Aestuariibacter sp. AA17]
MIKELYVLSAKCIFSVLSTAWAIVFVISLAIALPFYQAFWLSLEIDSSFYVKVAYSILASVIYYFFTYGAVKLMDRISEALYQSGIQDYLSIIQVFLLAAFLLLVCEALLQPDSKIFDSSLNKHLTLLAIYFAVGSYNNNRSWLLRIYFGNVFAKGRITKEERVKTMVTLLFTFGVVLIVYFLKTIDV